MAATPVRAKLRKQLLCRTVGAGALTGERPQGRDADRLEHERVLMPGDAQPALVDFDRGWHPAHRRRRHGESDGPQPDWLPTSERFLDPTTDRLMRVWLDPATRTRHYVPEPRD